MMIGRCCLCANVPGPANDCQGAFYRIARAYPTPAASVPNDGPVHAPGIEWYWKTYDPPGNPLGVDSVWQSDFYLAKSSAPALEWILLPPMRYVMEYPTADDTNWNRGDFAADGKQWPIAVSNTGLTAPVGSAMHAVDGAFGYNSHIETGQKIATGPPVESGEDARQFDHGSKQFSANGGAGRTLYINFDPDAAFVTHRARLRYVRPIVNGSLGSILDVIPEDKRTTISAVDGYWYEFNGPFTSDQVLGQWEHNINIPFNGGQIEWDVWIETYGDPPAGGAMIQEEDTTLVYNLRVLPDWDKTTEDWQLTFSGGDSPASPDNTIKFSEMTNSVISECYCSGQFTWPAPWDNTTLECYFFWNREVVSIHLESLQAGEEFGPYNSADETYLSGGSTIAGLQTELIERWYDSSTNQYYRGQSNRGLWRGESQFFPQAFDAQKNAGSYAADRLSGGWPTGVSIVRTTQ